MVLGKVVGTVVSTRKEDELSGLKFLLVRACDVDGKPTGGTVVAVDAVGAGVGELVSVHVIPRPHVNIDLVLPLGRQNEAGAEGKASGK